MRKSLLVLCFFGCVGFSPVNAHAAAPGVAVDWSGLYAGLHAGYGWSNLDVELRDPPAAVAILDLLGAPTGASHDLNGFLAGGHVGVQKQWGRWVLGVEAALTLGGVRDNSSETFSGSFLFTSWNGESTFRTEISDFMSIAGRVGYAQDRWLAYVKGGFATASVSARGALDGEACLFFVCSNFNGAFASKERHNGWVAGGGLEYMLTNNIIVGVEYSYTDLGGRTHAGTGTLDTDIGTFSGETKLRVDPDAVHSVMGRLSFKIGP